MKKTFTALSLAVLLISAHSLVTHPSLAATGQSVDDAGAASAAKPGVEQTKKKSKKKKRGRRSRRAPKKS
jgi:hypothetical protein